MKHYNIKTTKKNCRMFPTINTRLYGAVTTPSKYYLRTIVDIKMRLWTFWIIVGLLGQLGDTLFRGECQSEGYFKDVHNNARLRNYVISTRDVYSLEDCVSACLSDPHCNSYNFQVSGVPLHKCELNFKSRSTARLGSLVLDNGFQYYEISDSKETESLCETIGCQNGGTCQENCETLSFPHKKCKCTSLFTGNLCEKRKVGNFLLNYDGGSMNDHTSVSVTGKDFQYLAVYVWVKPSASDGVVFSYATERNPREMMLLFSDKKIVLHLGGEVIPFNITLPVKKWSHICFILYKKIMLQLYYNGLLHSTSNIIELLYNNLQHDKSTVLPQKITIKGTGIMIPGFEQVSPGVVDKNSNSNLTVTRLYVVDKSELVKSEILRLFNEPSFSDIARDFRVDWREFYQPEADSNASALVTPSNEPDLGNFDLRFPGNPSISINIPYIPPLDTFTLSMWIRVNTSYGKDATIFELDSELGTVLKLQRRGLGNDFYFFFGYPFPTMKFRFPNVIKDNNWFHLAFRWTKSDGAIYQYKHGSFMHPRRNESLNMTMPEIHNGTIRISDGTFVGDITSLNFWSMLFDWNMFISLALNPGNAAGDIFYWKSLMEKSYETSPVVPSTCHQRPGQFDVVFPEQNRNSISYLTTSSPYANKFNSITAAFWIKIPSIAEEFTLISYAVPSQVNEFSVHFGTTGISVYLHGILRFIPLMRSELVDRQWHHFLISHISRSGLLYCYHNGKLIKKDYGPSQFFIAKDGVLVIGAQQTRYNEVNEFIFQFTGEISQLQIYRRTFSHVAIQTLSARCLSIPGNFFRWVDMPAGVKGQVHIRHQSECLKAKNGEVN